MNSHVTVTLTREQAEELKTLFGPQVEFDEEGEIDKDFNLQSEVYSQLLPQLDTAKPCIWVNLYRVTTQYGGPEEGGWTYEHYDLVSASAGSSTVDIQRLWDNNLDDLLEDGERKEGLKIDQLRVQYAMSGQTYATLMFQDDTYGEHYYMCLSTTRAGEQTYRKPHYC